MEDMEKYRKEAEAELENKSAEELREMLLKNLRILVSEYPGLMLDSLTDDPDLENLESAIHEHCESSGVEYNAGVRDLLITGLQLAGHDWDGCLYDAVCDYGRAQATDDPAVDLIRRALASNE